MNKEITTEDNNATLKELLSKFGITSDLNHEYHQVLAIHREVGAIANKMDRLEDKMDKVLDRLTYLCATDNEKKYMF